MSYLSPLLAIVVGVVHAGLAPVIVIGGVKPNLVLIAVVLVTCHAGLMPGITWAFTAGLTVNLLVGEPLGAIPLGLLLVVTLVSGGSSIVGRLVWIFPVLAAFLGSIVGDVVTFSVSQLVTDAAPASPPLDILLAAATLNAAIVVILLVPVRVLVARYATRDAPAW